MAEDTDRHVAGTVEYTTDDGRHGTIDLPVDEVASRLSGDILAQGKYVTQTPMWNGAMRIDVDLSSLSDVLSERPSVYMADVESGAVGRVDTGPKSSFVLLLPNDPTEDDILGSQLFAVGVDSEPQGAGVEFRAGDYRIEDEDERRLEADMERFKAEGRDAELKRLLDGIQSIVDLGTFWGVFWPDGRPVTCGEMFAGIVGTVAMVETAQARVKDATDGTRAELPRQDTKRPTKHVQTLSKVSTDISKVENGETVRFDMSGKNEAHVYTALSLNYEGEDISLSKPINPYDESVHNAVATLWAAGNRTITPTQVAKVLTGKDKPGAGSISDATASMDKQRRTFVTIDFSAELRGRTGELDGEKFTAEQCVQETYMLDATKTRVTTARGNEVVGYTLNSAPILYLHDMMTGQITSYPQSLLKATAKAVSSTQTNITMRDYLIGRISRMKNPHSKTARNIVYDTVFEHIGRGGASPKDRRRMIESARSILNALESEGFMAGWSEYTESGSSHRTKGVTIKTKGKK